MKKVKVIDRHSVKSIKYERELLSKINHPFIVNMYYSFQDYDYLYLIMDLLNGGIYVIIFLGIKSLQKIKQVSNII